LHAYDLDYQGLGDCAFARFPSAKNEIATIPSFEVQGRAIAAGTTASVTVGSTRVG